MSALRGLIERWRHIQAENQARRERRTWLDLEVSLRDLDRRLVEAEERITRREALRDLQLVVDES